MIDGWPLVTYHCLAAAIAWIVQLVAKTLVKCPQLGCNPRPFSGWTLLHARHFR